MHRRHPWSPFAHAPGAWRAAWVLLLYVLWGPAAGALTGTVTLSWEPDREVTAAPPDRATYRFDNVDITHARSVSERDVPA